MNKKSNIKDVARLANVSTATVSRFLNGDLKRMSSKTAFKVNSAINILHYVPNFAARQMVTNSSRMIAVIVANIDDYFSTEIFKGVSTYLESNGYIAVLFDTNASEEREKEILKNIKSYNFDGIIFQPNTTNWNFINSNLFNDTPTVLIDREFNGIKWPQVLSNNYEIARTATLYFNKNGFKHIIVLTSKIDCVSTRRERFYGIKSVTQNIDIIEISETIYNMKEIIKKLLKLIKSSNDKTVIFSLKERWLLEIVPYLISKRILDNINLTTTGFIDTNIIRSIVPNAKFITQNSFLMGGTAAELLVKIIKSKQNSDKKIIIPAKFF
ncbi:LacI family transcriptional regulator [Bombilactobacillus bombi]|uniref:LacI family DNA-binding transcriptional regulator n=1 Tax=Bombilactobacillus bombi TaxID=1303590 RepID=UPI000E58AAB1|nr:LacI family DNA-binding transcriptional regulator [Bombilactobacillus bombi]AXX65092.1 LacI family transcriptional regulator [Bombilactobacillus bombi]